MSTRHSKATIAGAAIVSIGLAALLHEGLGHGVTAALRGDVVTELTSNHLSSLRSDRLVDCGGTVVNLLTGAVCMIASHFAGRRANARFFLWFFASINLLQGAGYFMFSGISSVGDWNSVIAGLPHQATLHVAMTVFGAVLYIVCARIIAIAVRPFAASRGEYNIVGRFPYLVACIFYCIAGAFDPLGIKLLFLSTIPAAFGGMSGLLWADSLMPRIVPADPLAVKPSPAWLWTAAIFGGVFIVILGRGIEFHP